MEQNNQQDIEKLAFPIKTKVVAWLFIFIWFSYFLCLLSFKLPFLKISFNFNYFLAIIFSLPIPLDFYFFIGLIISVILLILGIFLLKKKKWAWWFSFICMSFHLFIVFLYGFVLRGLFIPLVVFILFLSDRKNFWKIAN
jgi:hypothetical protein